MRERGGVTSDRVARGVVLPCPAALSSDALGDLLELPINQAYAWPMLKGKYLVLLAVCGTAFAGAPHIVELSPDTYLLTETNYAGMFYNHAKMKAKVIQEANDFAAKQGKIAIPLNMTDSPPMPGRSMPNMEYQFRVVGKDDPEARRVSLDKRPDQVIQKDENIKVDVHTKDDTAQKPPDLYSELLKLDDLKKRGIISQAEFDAQKAKLLAQ